jgi:hypothetical protein
MSLLKPQYDTFRRRLFGAKVPAKINAETAEIAENPQGLRMIRIG